MSRPGVTLTRSETRPARSARTTTGPAFIVGLTGTVDADALGVAKPCLSLTDYATRFGSRAAHVTAGNAFMYDTAEFFFKEGGSELFVKSATTFDAAGVTAALALIPKSLGPGQVAAPGLTVAAGHAAVMAHGLANNRIPILDAPDTPTVATLTAATTVAGATAESERISGLFAPWVVVPGVTSGTTRTIPPSAIVMGLMSYNDGRGITPNQPSAGAEYGESAHGLRVTQTYAEADRVTLNANGLNLLRDIYGGVRVYGYRTLADPTADELYLPLSNARLFMAVHAEGEAIAERFVFRQLDGRRLTTSQYGGELAGMLLPYWERGSLYGDTPDEAFSVDVGPNVNTDESMAAGFLKAIVRMRMSPFGEEVVLELVKARITEAL